jgi:PAS domain S-box-containing protein
MHAREALSLGGGSRYFRPFLNSLADAVVIADEHLLVWGYNGAAQRLFGYPPAEVLGRPLSLVIAAQDGRPDFAALAAGGELPAVRYAIEGRRKDGSRYRCELAVTGFAVDGQRYLVCVARDQGSGGSVGSPGRPEL